METMLTRAQQLKPKLIEWRRHLHQNPEIGLEEWKTSAFVRERLEEMGVTELQTMAQTGVCRQYTGRAGRPHHFAESGYGRVADYGSEECRVLL